MKNSSILESYTVAIKQAIAVIFLTILFSSISWAQEQDYQRHNLFNYDWKFHLGDTTNAHDVSFIDTDWRVLDLPHDWSIEGSVSFKNPMGNDGGYFPAGIGWYRKTFDMPKYKEGKKTEIYFEGVYMNSEVFVNGISLGVYPYGYTSFSYDLTPHLKYGVENTIAVKVDNSKQKNSRWYTGSGIYRNVWLITKNDVSIAQWGVGVTTEAVKKESAIVKISTLIESDASNTESVYVRTTLLDTKGNQIGKSSRQNLDLSGLGESTIEQKIRVANPKLWSPETPTLYIARVEVMIGKKLLDRVDTKFGIRAIDFSAEEGFKLNGSIVKLNGGNVHHDNGSLGAAAYDRAEIRKVELLKAAGFNAVRSSHNPPSPRFLDACDSIGLLVIDESFDNWRSKKTDYDYSLYFDKWAEKDVQAMVKRDRNHPSIIVWSIGNEIIERKEVEAVETAKMLSDAVKAIDSTRPVTSAMTTWDADWEVFDPLMAAHDVAGYNYQLHRAPKDHERVPSRIILQTESYPRDAFANWKLVHDNPYIIGDFVWTAMDYLGESGIGRWFYTGEVTGEHYDRDLFPWHGAYCGDIDLTGWRKPISHYRDLLYNQGEKLYLAVKEPNPEPLQIHETLWSVWPTWESWTWPGFEGRELDVEIYSGFPKVRLYLNQKLIGEKETNITTEFKATFQVPYSEGELKAVALDQNGNEITSQVLRTAAKISKLRLTADRTEIRADGQDLSYVAIEVTDDDGTIIDLADDQISVSIDGPGVLLGIDNGNLKDSDPYTASCRSVWKGRALAVVKGLREKGDIKITISYPGVEDQKILISNR